MQQPLGDEQVTEDLRTGGIFGQQNGFYLDPIRIATDEAPPAHDYTFPLSVGFEFCIKDGRL